MVNYDAFSIVQHSLHYANLKKKVMTRENSHSSKNGKIENELGVTLGSLASLSDFICASNDPRGSNLNGIIMNLNHRTSLLTPYLYSRSDSLVLHSFSLILGGLRRRSSLSENVRHLKILTRQRA